MNKNNLTPFAATHPGEMIKDELKERGMTQKQLAMEADIWMNLQTQYDLDTANIAERGNQRETVSVTIPVRDRTLLQELVRKFGWACVF